jgi:hypothetical protein
MGGLTGNERKHELKTWPEPFEAVWDERKRFEFRRDDRGFGVGDVLLLREFDPATQSYTGRSISALVLYISRGPDFGIPDGHVVMSLDGAYYRRP